MSKRKVSDIQRLITWAMSVTEPELATMTETIAAIRESRFPRVVKPKPRAVRSDKGQSRRPQQLAGDAAAGEGDPNV